MPARKKSPRKKPAKKPVDIGSIEKIGPATSVSLLKHTGKNWEQWIALLDKAGGRELDRPRLMAFLKKAKAATPWWQQWIAAGYEIHTGKRMPGRDLKGNYSVLTTRTFHLPPAKVWKKLVSPEGIRAWLRPMDDVILKEGQGFEIEGGVFGEVRKVKVDPKGRAGRFVRMTWQEIDWPKPTTLEVYVYDRQNGSCILAFQHTKLRDGRLREPLKERWKSSLEDFTALLNSSS